MLLRQNKDKAYWPQNRLVFGRLQNALQFLKPLLSFCVIVAMATIFYIFGSTKPNKLKVSVNIEGTVFSSVVGMM